MKIKIEKSAIIFDRIVILIAFLEFAIEWAILGNMVMVIVNVISTIISILRLCEIAEIKE